MNGKQSGDELLKESVIEEEKTKEGIRLREKVKNK